jgi:hypothetical protein
MWKVVAIVLAVFILGHFLIRYVRTNPLDPDVDGTQVVVESQDYRVHFRRNGAVSGTYFILSVTSQDWTSRPLNARFEVFGMQSGAEYARMYPDFHLYGSDSATRLAAVATPLAVIAAERGTYGQLRALIDRFEDRAGDGGELLCVTLSGDALSIDSAESLEDGHDVTDSLQRGNAEEPIVFVDQLDVDDCSALLAASH